MAESGKREATFVINADGVIDLERFEVNERLSELYEISAQVLCPEVIDFYPVLGAPAAIRVTDEAGSPVRAFDGLLYEAEYVETVVAGHRYKLTIRPWLYTLSRNLDYRIYQDKNAVDIIEDLFHARGINPAAYDFTKLSGSPPVRPYCVQYRESDFQFISRLMEEEGIYYYFKHTDQAHVLVLCNGRASHTQASYSSLPFINPLGGGSQTYADRVWSWREWVGSDGERKATLKNLDYRNPPKVWDADDDAGNKPKVQQAEIYDFPAPFDSATNGTNLAKTIMRAAHAEQRFYEGEGDATALFCGALVKISRHPIDRLNQEYLVVGLDYSLETQTYRSGSDASGPPTEIYIEAVPADAEWRAPIKTPKPVARGPETAIVTGPAGEVIYTDDQGRVKVQFFWDRLGKHDDKTTCFIRVSHSSADKGFGHIVLPRIGQEVIVDFLNGDPDRPVITGRLYNTEKMQAEALPAQKTRSTWRSQTVGELGDYSGSEKGPPAKPGFNAIGMEDKGGEEKLVFWASRQRIHWIWLDDNFWVNRDETRRIGRDRKTNVKNNETLTVEDGDMSTTVNTGNQETKIKTGNQSNEVSQGNQTNKVSQGNKSIEISMGNMDTQVKMGNYTLKTSLGSISMEAMQQIELKVGANSIKIDQTGVTIKGIMVQIEGQAMLTAKSPMTQVNGDGMLTLKGGITMIN